MERGGSRLARQKMDEERESEFLRNGRRFVRQRRKSRRRSGGGGGV
jgi:hypothetical protein